MTFSQTLSGYMERFSISVSGLSDESGLSKATISRFKNGRREPANDSEAIGKMAAAISRLSGGAVGVDEVAKSLEETLDDVATDFEHVAKNLNVLIDSLEINANDLSRYLKFDPSYLSRIRSGKRRPANISEFCSGVANFVCSNVADKSASSLAYLIGCDEEEVTNPASCKISVLNWLTEGEGQQESAVERFLQVLDEFNLNEYIRSIKFDELKVPTVPFQFPTKRNYYDMKGFMQSELDWLRATVTSRQSDSVIMYSDMPIAEMSQEGDFPKQWMYGIALMLKKGLHLDMIHNVDRSFHEMMLGLEAWIPLYMTGQVSPYYLRGYNDAVFNHFIRVSGATALSGEAIVGLQDRGMYHLTNNKEELAYYRRRGEDLLSKARPLMEIYDEDNEKGFQLAIGSMLKDGSELKKLDLQGHPFENIEINVIDGECVIVSKSNSPAIHFVIRHPKLRQAIENMVVPIVE